MRAAIAMSESEFSEIGTKSIIGRRANTCVVFKNSLLRYT